MVVRVVCVGNSIARDDGVGIYVAKILEACALPANVVVERRPSLGFELLDLLEQDEQRIILVDALRTGAPPGTCRAMDIHSAAALAGAPFCCHALGLAEVLGIAARLPDKTLPHRLTIVGTEAQDLEGWGTELSAPVRAALPELLSLLVDELGGDARLKGQALEAAGRLEPFSLEEALGLEASFRDR